MSTVPFSSSSAVAPAGRGRRRFAGWRPALRMAWRDALRTKARTLLVVVLIAVPVGVMVFADVVIRTTSLTDRQQQLLGLGKKADALVFLHNDLAGATASFPAGVEHTEVTDVFAGRVKLGDKYRFARIQVADLTNPLLAGAFTVTKGIAPRTADEAVISRNIARARHVRIGDEILLRRNQQRWRVVGVYEQADALSDDSIVVAQRPTGSFPEGSSSTRSFVKASPEMLRLMTKDTRRSSVMTTRDPTIVKPYGGGTLDRLTPVLSLYTAGTVGLFVVGIVVSAAFAVAARRRLRGLGLAAASGGSPAQLRMTVVAQGVVAGLVGVIVGFAFGALGVAIGLPRIRRFVNYGLPGVHIVPIDLVIVALMAMATAIIAALVPAVSMSRIPVGAALAGRRPLRPASGRTPIVGLGLFVVGLVVLGASVARVHTPFGTWFRYAISGGAMLLGSVLCMPWLIGKLEPLAGRLRGSSRLAARSMARGRSRTGPITAAILAAAGATMTMASFDESSSASTSSSVAAGSLVDVVDVYGNAFERDPTSSDPLVIDDATLARVSTALPGAKVVRFNRLENKTGLQAGFVWQPVASRGTPESGVGVSPPFITLSSEALATLGAPANTIKAFEQGSVVVMGAGLVRDGSLALQVVEAQISDGPVTPTTRSLSAVEVGSYLSTSSFFGQGAQLCDPGCHAIAAPPTIVVPPALITELDMRLGQSIAHFELPKPVTNAQRDELRALRSDLYDEASAKADAGEDAVFATIDFADTYGPNRVVQAILLAVVTVAALAVTAIGLALSAAEGRDEEATLLSLGAPPKLRRSRRAWEALFTSGIACVLAVPLGFLPAAVVIANRALPYPGARHDPIVFPWRVGLGLGIALPLLAAVVFWLVTRPQRVVLVRED